MARSEKRLAWELAHKEHLRAYHRAWSAKNKHKIRGYAQKRRASDPDGVKKIARESRRLDRLRYPERTREADRRNGKLYRTRHAESVRSAKRKWKKTPAGVDARKRYEKKHHERILKKGRAYVAANRQKVAANEARWRKQYPEKKVIKEQRRRARIRGARGDGITTEQWARLKRDYAGLCAHCATPTKRPQLDHIDPVSRGGDHDVANAVPACSTCNQSKNNTPLVVWLARRAAAA